MPSSQTTDRALAPLDELGQAFFEKVMSLPPEQFASLCCCLKRKDVVDLLIIMERRGPDRAAYLAPALARQAEMRLA